MKTKLLFIIITSFIIVSCEKNENNTIKDFGYVLFYTNAQFVLNCGEFDVNVYINDSIAGKIKQPFLPIDSVPYCESNNTASVLKLKKMVGIYNYSADFYCSNKNQWSGNFKIVKDSCTIISLDAWTFANNEQKLMGTWVEKYPEKYDGISDTLSFDKNMNVSRHFYFAGWKYRVNNDTLTLYSETRTYVRKFTFTTDRELYFPDFLQRTITNELKPTCFINIK